MIRSRVQALARKCIVPVNLEADKADALRELSLKTRIPQQQFLREAVALILEKYREAME
jgi:type III secretion system FlhB-like substrate exporter